MKKDVQLDKDLVAKAAGALLQHLKENKAKHTQKELIEVSFPPNCLGRTPLMSLQADDTISLIIALKRIPDKVKAKPIQMYAIGRSLSVLISPRSPLTHSLAPESQDICVFTKDPQADFKKMFQELAVPGVSKVWCPVFTPLRLLLLPELTSSFAPPPSSYLDR